MGNEVKRIDFRAAMERTNEVLTFRDGLKRERPVYSEEDCQQLLMSIGRRYVPGFTIDKDNAFAYENIRRWADNRDFQCLDPITGATIQGNTKLGLYICGPTGSGKSALVDIIRTYIKVLGYRVIHNTQPSQMQWTPRRADEICNEFLATGDMAPYISENILCIDDAGTEPSETLYMGNRVQVIKAILEARGDRPNKITIITSNTKVSQEIYGDRVASRLCNMCNYFELVHPDWRKAR